MQYKEKILAAKMKISTGKILIIFLNFAQNIDCGYMLEPPPRGSSNECLQSMFWSKNKKNRYTPVSLYRIGVKWCVHCMDMFS